MGLSTTPNGVDRPVAQRRWRAFFDRCLDLLYPRECVVTGEPVEENSPCRFLSREGLRGLFYIDDPCCSTCGAPFYGALIAARECPHCVELNPAYSRGRSLFLLRDAGRELIHELKYRKGRHLLPDLGWIAAQRPRFGEFLSGAILVPIPLHPVRERERGFNQSRLIAVELAASSGSGVVDLLERVKYTETQTRLDRGQRRANMRGAFAIAKGQRVESAQRYVLVDDVFTTGSTLNSAAKALLKAGAAQVDVVTLGHG